MRPSTMRRDIDTVRNAIKEPWSNGQTEGQINKPQNPQTGYVWSTRARTSARAYVACVGTFATEIEEEPANAAADLQNTAQTLHRQHARFSQWQVANNCQHKLFELLAGRPSWQSDGIEATGQCMPKLRGCAHREHTLGGGRLLKRRGDAAQCCIDPHIKKPLI